VLRWSCVLLLENQDASRTRPGPGKREHSHTCPAEPVKAADQTLRVVATDLVHAELFGELSGQINRGDELKSVASGQGTTGIQTE